MQVQHIQIRRIKVVVQLLVPQGTVHHRLRIYSFQPEKNRQLQPVLVKICMMQTGLMLESTNMFKSSSKDPSHSLKLAWFGSKSPLKEPIRFM